MTETKTELPDHKPGSVAKRFGINLTEKDVKRLWTISKENDITPTEVFRRALATEFRLLELVRDGGQILVKKNDGTWLEMDMNYG